MSLLHTAITLRGTRASQPAAASAKKGSVYCVTDENNILERCSGTSWEAYSPVATPNAITALTGDVTASGPGSVAATIANLAVTTGKIAADAVTYAKLQNISATDRLLGRDSAGPGDAEELTVGGGVEFTGSGGIQRSALTGDVTATAGSNATTIATDAVTTAKIAADQVTFAKIQNSSGASKILGRGSASGAGDFEELTTGAQLAISTTTIKTKEAWTFIFDGGGVALTTGLKGFFQTAFAGTITQWRLLSIDAAMTSGSIVVDIWKDSFANRPPALADTITASAKPTISTNTGNSSSSLTGWTTTFSAGDVFAFNVDSITSLTRVQLILEVTLD